MIENLQTQICRKYDVPLVRAEADSVFGFAAKIGLTHEPLHGLRHASERCPESIPYLGLPAGWRFLLKDKYADVWFDESLLKVSTS